MNDYENSISNKSKDFSLHKKIYSISEYLDINKDYKCQKLSKINPLIMSVNSGSIKIFQENANALKKIKMEKKIYIDNKSLKNPDLDNFIRKKVSLNNSRCRNLNDISNKLNETSKENASLNIYNEVKRKTIVNANNKINSKLLLKDLSFNSKNVTKNMSINKEYAPIDNNLKDKCVINDNICYSTINNNKNIKNNSILKTKLSKYEIYFNKKLNEIKSNIKNDKFLFLCKTFEDLLTDFNIFHPNIEAIAKGIFNKILFEFKDLLNNQIAENKKLKRINDNLKEENKRISINTKDIKKVEEKDQRIQYLEKKECLMNNYVSELHQNFYKIKNKFNQNLPKNEHKINLFQKYLMNCRKNNANNSNNALNKSNDIIPNCNNKKAPYHIKRINNSILNKNKISKGLNKKNHTSFKKASCYDLDDLYFFDKIQMEPLKFFGESKIPKIDVNKINNINNSVYFDENIKYKSEDEIPEIEFDICNFKNKMDKKFLSKTIISN